MAAARDPLLAARLRLLATAVLFSTGPTAIKACGLGPWQVAGFRSGTAALFLLALLPDRRQLLRPRLWLVGAAYSGTLVCYAVASKLTTAANAIFLQYSGVVWILLLSAQTGVALSANKIHIIGIGDDGLDLSLIHI